MSARVFDQLSGTVLRWLMKEHHESIGHLAINGKPDRWDTCLYCQQKDAQHVEAVTSQADESVNWFKERWNGKIL